MSQSPLNQKLPVPRDKGHRQDINGCPNAISLGNWRRLPADALAVLKRLAYIFHDARKGAAVDVSPQDTKPQNLAMPNRSDIYDLAVATFLELGMPAPIDVCETLYVKNGYFIGHRFHCDGGYAMWGEGWNAVEFYDENGKLLKMIGIKKAMHSPLRYKPAA